MSALKNSEAEKCAQFIAACSTDEQRRSIYNVYLSEHPELKRWEASAIANRALQIVSEKTTVAPRRL